MGAGALRQTERVIRVLDVPRGLVERLLPRVATPRRELLGWRQRVPRLQLLSGGATFRQTQIYGSDSKMYQRVIATNIHDRDLSANG